MEEEREEKDTKEAKDSKEAKDTKEAKDSEDSEEWGAGSERSGRGRGEGGESSSLA
jgi:hypothetical protein